MGGRRPEVLISVTGAASGVPPMEKKQQLVFRRGLLKAARRTRAWILTGGSHAGVMAMVGQTVRQASEDQHVVCLGVSSWGAVLGHEKMEKKGNGKVFQYSQRELTEAEDGEGEEGEGKERVALDPYHTHFVFVDDGSEASTRSFLAPLGSLTPFLWRSLRPSYTLRFAPPLCLSACPTPCHLLTISHSS